MSADGDLKGAVDALRLDELASLARLACSYWASVALAADRGDAHTVAVHLKQAVAVARAACTVAGELRQEQRDAEENIALKMRGGPQGFRT